MKEAVTDCISDGNEPESILNEAKSLSGLGTQGAFVWAGDL